KPVILRHAWLNLRNKHMTTGRINQVEGVLFKSPNPLPLQGKEEKNSFQGPPSERQRRVQNPSHPSCAKQVLVEESNPSFPNDFWGCLAPFPPQIGPFFFDLTRMNPTTWSCTR